MKTGHITLIPFAALSLASCSPAAETGKDTSVDDVAGSENAGPKSASSEKGITESAEMTPEEYRAAMEKQHREYDNAEYKPITIYGYSCGDNCYVEYWPKVEGGGDQTALCSADICAVWERAGGVPDGTRKRAARAKFSTGPRVDGSGAVVDKDYPLITDIKFDDAQPAADKAAKTDQAASALPLKTGNYVLEGSSCKNPPNAVRRRFDGRGISGSATRDCRFDIKEQSGQIYRGPQSCVDTYTSQRSSTDIIVTIVNDEKFSLKGPNTNQSFRYCGARS